MTPPAGGRRRRRAVGDRARLRACVAAPRLFGTGRVPCRRRPIHDRKGNMHRRRIHGGTGIATVLIAAGLLVPAGATAAPARPDVTTGPAANVAQNSVTLTGGVTPERGGHDLPLPVRDHAQLRRAASRCRPRARAAATAAWRSRPTSAASRRRRPTTTGSSPATGGRAAGRGPDVPHQAPAARAHARRHAEPGRAGRAHDDRGRAVGHGQRRAADPAAEQPVPVHAGLPERVQRPAHQRRRDLLVPDPVGVAQHAVPRVAAQPAAGPEPDRRPSASRRG